MPAVQAVPDEYPGLIPYVTMKGAAEAIRFYTKVLGATPRGDVLPGPGGTIGHAELQIGKSVLMLADADPSGTFRTAKDIGACPVNICLYVEDVDKVVERAVEHGATLVQEVEDKFYGDRSGSFQDPWGYVWTIMTHVEDVSHEEMGRRVEKLMQGA